MRIAVISSRGAWAKEPSSAAPYFMTKSLNKYVGETTLLIPDGPYFTAIKIIQKCITLQQGRKETAV